LIVKGKEVTQAITFKVCHKLSCSTNCLQHCKIFLQQSSC